MRKDDIERIVQSYAKEYPALINVTQAAAIAQVAKGTIHDWSHQQRLDEIKTRVGRELRLDRDGFVRFLLGPGQRPG